MNHSSIISASKLLMRSFCALAFGLISACSGGAMNSSNASSSPANLAASAGTSGALPGAASANVQGVLHGGQSPITGSTLTLYAAGQPASAAPTQLQTATTDAQGNFQFAGFSCSSPKALIYVVAAGGNAGGGNNSAIKLMAALGPCSSMPNPIVINELTTVAAVYALNAFSYVNASQSSSASGGLSGCVDCIPTTSSDMTQLHGNVPAITNGFATAALLADVASGEPAASLPPVASCIAGPGGPAVGEPVNCGALQKLTGIANSLSGCVNSGSSASAQCTELFACATPGATFQTTPTVGCTLPGTVAGAGGGSAVGLTSAITDTLVATLSIARNPGQVSVAGIEASTPHDIVFNPGQSVAPTDWTIALNFTGGGLNSPKLIAIDAEGNVWVTNFQPVGGIGSVTELSPTGAPLSPSTGFTGGGLDVPNGIAIDITGKVWVANALGSVTELSAAGAALSPASGFTGGGLNSPFGVAVDPSGNVWVTNTANNSVTELSAAGSALSSATGFTGGGLNGPLMIALDSNGSVWVGNDGNNTVTELSATGVAISPAAGFTGGGLFDPVGIAADANGNVWLANFGHNSLAEFGTDGVARSIAAGFTGGGVNRPQGLALDGAGNVWTANYLSGSLTEFLNDGVALSPTSGFTGGGLDHPLGIAVDGSGNVWVTDSHANSVTEFIGAAAPTVTPLVAQFGTPSAVLSSIAVTPATILLGVGATKQLTVTGTYSDGTTKVLTAAATWTTSNAAVATISSPGGLAMGVAGGGPVTITASVTQNGQTVTGAAQLTVLLLPTAGLTCYPAPANKGTGTQVWDTQSYCASLIGATTAGYVFTAGTLAFTTDSNGNIVSCQYATSGTFDTDVASAPPVSCVGTIGFGGTLTLHDTGTVTAGQFTGVFSGTQVSGSFFSPSYGPGPGSANGAFSGQQQ